MSDIKILIIEDSHIFATELEMLVTSIGYKPIGVVDNSEEALQIISEKEPDLILMDVDIKGKLNGLEIAEKIEHLDIAVLFISSHNDDEFYERSKKLSHTVNYLVKPLDDITLKSNIESALRELSSEILSEENSEEIEDFILNNCIFFKKNSVLVKVPIESITHAESDGNYCRIFSKDKGSFFLRSSLSKMAEVLPSKLFIRIHRKHLINANYIESIELSSYEILLEGENMPIGRRYKDMLLAKLNTMS